MAETHRHGAVHHHLASSKTINEKQAAKTADDVDSSTDGRDESARLLVIPDRLLQQCWEVEA